MRLDKFVAEQGGLTRSAAGSALRGGRVMVDGQVVRDGAAKIDEEKNIVVLDGEKLAFQRFVYFMLNKPVGVVSATRDRADSVVVELIAAEDRKKRKLFPVGRLDKDTEGLLLITDDGELAHRLLSPKKHVDKLYFAKLRRAVTEEDISLFASGMRVDEELTALPAGLRELSEDEGADFLAPGEYGAAVTLSEGKFHQVKRMFAATGNEVLFLKRMAMGGVWLDKALLPGEYRELTGDELARLKGNMGDEK